MRAETMDAAERTPQAMLRPNPKPETRNPKPEDAAEPTAETTLRRHLFRRQAELCAALADPTRLEILHLLGDGERTVGDLMVALGLRQNNVSQHLAYLRRVGAVAGERRGTHVYYRLAMPGLLEACEAVRHVLARQLATQADEAAALSRALERRDG